MSPGKLSSAHAQLEGSKKCKQCHARRGRVEPARCLACHDALNDSIKASRGYHASRASSRCGQCHQDHRGRKFDIIRWPSGSAESFNHKTVRYTLAGKHAQASCRDCHKPRFQVAPKVKRFAEARRRRTYLGLEQKCVTCHDDNHEGRLGDACQQCHDERSFEKPPRFDHDDARFALRGKHRDVECDDCHKQVGRTPEVLFRGLQYKTCDSCHNEPHKGAMADRLGQTTCERCHTNASWNQLLYQKADHSPRRMPLVGGHAKAKCGACHGPKIDKRAQATCASCHSDVHSGRFGQNCSQCHSIFSWRARPRKERVIPPAQLDAGARLGLTSGELSRVAFHQKARFPLTGLHVLVPCDKCHSRVRRGFKKRFQNIPHAACSDCHKDSHEGQFTGTPCRGCHTTDGWSLTTYNVDRHARSQYPLDGAHRGVPCARCHPTSVAARIRYRFTNRSCSSCHTGPHGGQFATEVDDQRPARTCAECHATSSFRTPRFDHDTTRLPLREAHATTACASCHRAAIDRKSPVTYRGLSPACADCHRDRHEAQFRRPPRVRTCGECHTQKNFRIANFDHDAGTDYPLTGKHVDTTCQACHFQVKPANSNDVVLYRLGQLVCADCHKSRHAGLAERSRGPSKKRLLHTAQSSLTRIDACEACHDTAGWGDLRTVANFDHSEVGYTLRGGHDNLGCARCHTARKPLSRQCSSCHTDRHNGRLGPDCASCHESSSWRSTDIRAQHNQTRLPLTGAHALTDCTSCHPRARGAQYIAVPIACVGCHREDYDNPAAEPDHRKVGFGTACLECHRPVAWKPAFFSHLTFPLRGAHRTATCNSCHEREPVPRTCFGCHENDLAAASNPDHRAMGFPQDCALCHTEVIWRPASYPMHEQYFPIENGDHSRFDCGDCHPNSADVTDFTCLEPCHRRSEMDSEHNGESGYMYESRACLMCHPDGRD